MRKLLLISAIVMLVPAVAFAGNIGSCGWGSKLFDGQGGIGPQVLAATTNGTSGNQTFAISSGTSGCTQDGVVRSTWKTAAFIDSNMNQLARDVSRGDGEALDSLALLLEVEESDAEVMRSTLQQNFARLFPAGGVSSQEVVQSLREVLAGSEQLAPYSARV